MFTGNINNPDFPKGTAWEEVQAWLRNTASHVTEDEHIIRDRDIYAVVQKTSCCSREQAIFESHKEYIDLHCCIEGEETIEWAPADSLRTKRDYDTQTDTALYGIERRGKTLTLTSGDYAVFFPGEAHMPKLCGLKTTDIRKVVVKINAKLLS